MAFSLEEPRAEARGFSLPASPCQNISFSHEKIEINEIHDIGEGQAQKHDRITAKTDDNAHDHRPQAQPQVRDRCVRSYNWTW